MRTIAWCLLLAAALFAAIANRIEDEKFESGAVPATAQSMHQS